MRSTDNLSSAQIESLKKCASDGSDVIFMNTKLLPLLEIEGEKEKATIMLRWIAKNGSDYAKQQAQLLIHYPESIHKFKEAAENSEKIIAKEEKAAAEAEAKKAKAAKEAAKHKKNQENRKLRALKQIYDMTYEEAKECPVQADIDKLDNAPRNEQFWKLIREGFINGKAALFLTNLQKHGAYKKLFPPTNGQSDEDQAQNDLWLQTSLAELDTYHNNPPDFPPGFLSGHHQRIPISMIILFVKELSPKPSDEEQRRVYDTYKIPYAYEEFIKRFSLSSTNNKKHKFLKEKRQLSNEQPQEIINAEPVKPVKPVKQESNFRNSI